MPGTGITTSSYKYSSHLSLSGKKKKTKQEVVPENPYQLTQNSPLQGSPPESSSFFRQTNRQRSFDDSHLKGFLPTVNESSGELSLGGFSVGLDSQIKDQAENQAEGLAKDQVKENPEKVDNEEYQIEKKEVDEEVNKLLDTNQEPLDQEPLDRESVDQEPVDQEPIHSDQEQEYSPAERNGSVEVSPSSDYYSPFFPVLPASTQVQTFAFPSSEPVPAISLTTTPAFTINRPLSLSSVSAQLPLSDPVVGTSVKATSSIKDQVKSQTPSRPLSLTGTPSITSNTAPDIGLATNLPIPSNQAPNRRRKMEEPIFQVSVFSGGENEDVEKFIEIIDMSFLLIEDRYPEDRRNRARLVYMSGYLTNEALLWWNDLEPNEKGTWEEAFFFFFFL